MAPRNRPGFRPALEGMETRTLLSAITHLLNRSQPRQAAINAQQAAPAPEELPPNPLYFPTGQPTRHEMARQRFVAKFVGPFTVGAGRFSGEAQQVYMRGSGGSNQFLHGDAQLAVITPADPTQPLGGSISMFDRNINTNSSIGFELAANPATDLDAAGRPVRMTITQVDGNLSGGLYAGAIAEGTVEIRYKPSGARSRRVSSQGTAVVTIRAQVYTPGNGSILRNTDIDPGGPSQGG